MGEGTKTSKTNNHILLVEDDRTMRMMLESKIEHMGYQVSTALNGKDAWDQLKDCDSDYDAIIVDREMPEMNGIELVEKLNSNEILRNIPVIMQTGEQRPEKIQNCIDAGIFYYVIKPSDETLLETTLKVAIANSIQYQKLVSSSTCIDIGLQILESATFHYSSLEEAEDLACFLSKCYKRPQDVLVGLSELLINAVEHGNLGIGYTEKTSFIKFGMWRDEIMRRAELPENRDKRVKVMLKKQEDGIQIRITDCGKGFDWRKYMILETDRIQDGHGRGIIRAKQRSFSKVEYNTKGNIVTAFTPFNE